MSRFRDFDPRISVIVTTYNRVDALGLVLQSLTGQSDGSFEVIVADDGSREETGAFVRDFARRCPVPLSHVWQPDEGFHAGGVRNLASQGASGDYLVYLDGDCVVQSDFVARHRALSEPGQVVTGSRILLGEALTQTLLQRGIWDESELRRHAWQYRRSGQMNKVLPLFVKLPDIRLRYYKGFVWRRIKACNLACWKADAAAIGGFGEDMEGGWGHEDADFVFRLHLHGVRRKSGAWATEALHLWHRMASREHTEPNRRRLQAKIDAWGAAPG